MFVVRTVAEGKSVLITQMIIKIDEDAPAQVCFPKDNFIFCNWVHHPNKVGYAIIRKYGWIRFKATTKKAKELLEGLKKESSAFMLEDSKITS